MENIQCSKNKLNLQLYLYAKVESFVVKTSGFIINILKESTKRYAKKLIFIIQSIKQFKKLLLHLSTTTRCWIKVVTSSHFNSY